ncbi:hypothetical protein JCM3775_002888 [Rhodotorula graminis]
MAALRTANLYHVDDACVKAFLGDGGSKATRDGGPRLDRLESLHVDFHWDGTLFESEAMQTWLAKLSQLPKLRVLRLVDAGIPTEPQPALAPKPIPCLPALESLAIAAGDLYLWTGAPLAQVAPKLVRLELTGDRPDHQVVAVLRKAPKHLRALVVTPHIRTCGPALDLVLPRFTQLRRLRLGRQLFDPVRLVPYLRSLPDLESLDFEAGAHVTDTLLDAILEGPHRLSRLRHLTLGHILAKPGMSLGGFLRDDVDGLEALGFRLFASVGWHRPEWPPGASEAGLRDAVRSCSARGIVVDGRALDALTWDEKYRLTRQGVILAWASRAKGRWDVARGLVGDTAVDAYRQGLEAARILDPGLGE